jgi:hypothetical protein
MSSKLFVAPDIGSGGSRRPDSSGATRRAAPSPSCSSTAEEDRTLRAVLVGMLRESAARRAGRYLVEAGAAP